VAGRRSYSIVTVIEILLKTVLNANDIQIAVSIAVYSLYLQLNASIIVSIGR
jgi:hypothetical protein